MQSTSSMLSLETMSTEADLLDALRNLTVASLKTLSKNEIGKVSGNKADLIGCLLTHWKRKRADSDTLVGPPGASSGTARGSNAVDVPVLAGIRLWNKDLSSLKDFTSMQLYKYLVNSRNNTFDKDSMKAYKSLKAYKYFSDHLVENVWANSEEEEMVIIRGYCHLSLKSKPTFGNFLTCREGTVV